MPAMNRLKRLQTKAAQGMIGLAILLLPQQGHALSFTVDSLTVGIGTTFNLNINVVDAVNLTSFQFDLAYDPTILQASVAGAAAGALLPGDWFFTSPGIVDNLDGQILGISASGSPVSGSGILATIEFTALSTGPSALTASNLFLNLDDPTSGGFTISNGSVNGGSPVPEASTVSLMAIGMLLLVGLRGWRDAEKPAKTHR